MNNEFILQDRIQKIRQIITQYGEDNFYISYSGGKDSTVLSHLVDMALPDNQTPRVYCDTGIELNLIRDFVSKQCDLDDRFIMIKPSKNVRRILEEYGYPFKSKEHSLYLDIYQRNGVSKSVMRYLQPNENRKTFGCPKMLRYQFDEKFNIHISKKCCDKLKKEPLRKWQREHNKPYTMTGVMVSEGGLRSSAKCLVFTNDKLKCFQPLAPLNKEWEKWFIDKYNVEICDIYKIPYNFERTGCKGCPYNPHLQKDLDTMEKFFPNERKQCEIIWKPIYDEYRRIGYRLKGGEE